jgi:hypothetical protein
MQHWALQKSKQMAKGFVYVLSNVSMPGLVKIGFTLKVPTERAMELGTTGVPAPFEVEYYCLVEDPASLEAQMHRALSAKRESNDREFFRLSPSEAIAAIASRAIAPEHAWYRSPLSKPRPARVECKKCGAGYVAAQYCPKCQLKLVW